MVIARTGHEVVVRLFGELAKDDFGEQSRSDRIGDAVTLDTNLLHDYWKGRPRKWAIEELLDRAARGSIDLVVTRYIRDDVPASPLRDRLDELMELGVGITGGVFTFGTSAFGGADFFGSDAFLNCQRALATWRPSKGQPPDSRDWNHLHAHYAKRRDYFLTWDEPLLELGALLENGFPLGVMKPDSYLDAGR